MASGDTLLEAVAEDCSFPATIFAVLEVLAGASTPVEAIHRLAFDDTTQEYIDFRFPAMPENYSADTGITIRLKWGAAEAASDVIEWQAALRRVADDAEDLDTTAHTYDYNVVVATAPSVIGEVAYDDITFTAGADMDSVVKGDYFFIRITRDPSPSSGTDVTGNGYLYGFEVIDT